MLFHKAILASLALECALAAPLVKRDFNYGSTPVRGVNIGGWLVLEPWITPSIFNQFGGSVVDEYTLCQHAGNAQQILQDHWSSWATLGDFQKIAANGINLVRIPVGYWAFQKVSGDPYIQGAAGYLEQAIGWARQTGLKVWIDLHGAPQGQNGFDNDGQKNAVGFTSGNSVAETLDVISAIASKYAGSDYSDVIAGIELLNEPLMGVLPGGRSAVQGYYQNGFGRVRDHGQAPVIIHDGFSNPNNWNGVLTGQGSGGAIVDHHEYQVFSNGDVAMSYQDHINAVGARAQGWGTGQDKFLIVGEWTAAMTDCATYLNGYGVGSRYDGSYNSPRVGDCGVKNDMSKWDNDMKVATTNYIKAQQSTYESMMQGWIFWNFKTESSPEWDFFRLVDAGIWPH